MAEKTLGFADGELAVVQGTGQITTFNQLGFKGKNDKPDGWYLPKGKGKVAIVLETKAASVDISRQSCVDELLKNVAIVRSQYASVVGILYNGIDARVFKNEAEVTDSSSKLEHKSYYLRLFTEQRIDKTQIYNVTKRINDSLEFDFRMSDLTDRMIFTACALVTQRYNPTHGLETQKGQGYDIVHAWINKKLADAIDADNANVNVPNGKLNFLIEEFNKIVPSQKGNTAALDKIIDAVCEIAGLVNSDYWNGEDVMAIFFNEFNRYRGKKKLGQVLTPDHVTSFMYRLIGVSKDDRVLDAACGTGAFIVKSMCNMIKESGGYHSAKATDIRTGQLFGIEMDRRVFALACANMLIHKDGKTNLEQLDSRMEDAAEWIRSKNITKVLMNPPYERKYGCMKIVANVLDAVPVGTLCAFILPDKKLEKDGGFKLLKRHTLETIVKMPEELFFGVGITTSIFVFRTGTPQGDQDVVCYYIEEDGLETVKNQGRQDVKNRWSNNENYWIKAIRNGEDPLYGTKKIIRPAKNRLSYPTPETPFEIYEEDFIKTLMDYELFTMGIDTKALCDDLSQKMLYSSMVAEGDDTVTISIRKGNGQ